MAGIDEEEGIAFFEWLWGGSYGFLVLGLSENGWVVVDEEASIS